MSDLFRSYTRVRIKDGQVANFKANLPLLAELTRNEPATRQYECFLNPEDRTAVWMLSFDDVDGFVAHMSSEETAEAQGVMFPLFDVEAIRPMGPIPQAMVDQMQGLGLPVSPGRALPGVNRLAAEPTDGFGVQVNFEATWKDPAEAARIASLMHGATIERPGVLHLEYIDFGDNRIHVHMAYKDAKSFVEWSLSEPSQTAAAALPDALIDTRVEVLGPVDDEAADVLANYGAIHYDRLDGWVDIR